MLIQSRLFAAAFTVAMAPTAFASSGHVNADGTLSPGASGIASVTHPDPGRYCILPKSLTVQAKQAAGKLFPQLSWDFFGGSPGDLTIVSLGNTATQSAALCPSAAYIEVVTQDADLSNPVSASDQDDAFDIQF